MSGSNASRLPHYAIALTLALALGGCELFERAQRTPRSTPRERTPETVEAPDSSAPDGTPKVADAPADSGDVDAFVNLDSIRLETELGAEGAEIALVMPFFGKRFSRAAKDLPDNSSWALNYYAGVKIGLEDLESGGQRAVLHVFDSEGDAAKAQEIVRDPEVTDAQAIIAPYLTESVRAAATSAQALNIPIVVPYSAAARLTSQGYDRLLQLNPGLLAHLDATAAFLADAYEPEQVVLVGLPDGSQDREVAYLLQRQRELAAGAAPWKTWKLNTADIGLQDLDWEDKFAEGAQTVFVFPSYRRPKLVASFLNQLQIGRAGQDATVVGMPSWADIRQLDPVTLEDLGVMIPGAFYVDAEDAEVRAFEEAFANAYGAIPELSAYLGYDAIRYLVPLANEHGRQWPAHQPPTYDGLVATYRPEPVYATTADSITVERDVARYENRGIRMLRYENFAYRPM